MQIENMKKIYITTLILLTSIVFSQAPRGFYVKGGISQTDLKSDDLATSPGIGYQLGIVNQIGYHESYNFQVEFLLNFKNFNVKSVEGDYSKITDTKFSSQTLDVGFYFNYFVLKPDQDKFFVGPQAGVDVSLLGEFIPASSSESPRYLPYLLDDNSFSNMSKVGLDAGVGITGGYNRFRFDLRYTLGLNNKLQNVETNERDEYNQYIGPSLSGKMNSVSFTVSYLIFKSKKKRK